MQPGEFLAIDASWTKGAHAQKGKLVVRPHYAVFAATETAVNVLAAAAAGAVGAMAGYVVRTIPGQYRDVPSYLTALEQLPAPEFDHHLWAAAQAAKWWVATPQDTTLLCKKVPLFDRYKFWMKRGDDNVGAVFGVPGKLLKAAEPMLAAWPRS
jgi:hypothetical protein